QILERIARHCLGHRSAQQQIVTDSIYGIDAGQYVVVRSIYGSEDVAVERGGLLLRMDTADADVSLQRSELEIELRVQGSDVLLDRIKCQAVQRILQIEKWIDHRRRKPAVH